MARLPLLTSTGFLAVWVLALAPSPSASAGEVSLAPHVFCAGSCRYMFYEGGTSLQFRASPGEANVVTVTTTEASYIVRDARAPLTAGKGCKAIDAQAASCSPPSKSPLIQATVDLGDGDDALSVAGSIGGRSGGQGGETRIAGGPGDDRISAGDGPETLDGGPGADELHGGGGNDWFIADESPRASDVFDGGTGVDAMTYSGSMVPVRVDLADLTGPQGEAGEGDRVRAIESVSGGAAGNELRGDSAPNRLAGGNRSDRITGGDGDDELIGYSGRDALSGGAGDDALATQDGGADDVVCGEGVDRMSVVTPAGFDDPLGDETTRVDAKDEVAPDCELVPFFGDREDLLLPVAPRRVGARTVSFENPCRRKRCRGEVRLGSGSPSRPTGRRSFDGRPSSVAVVLSPASQGLLAGGRSVRISVRWRLVFPDELGDSRYRTTYRTTIAVRPAASRR